LLLVKVASMKKMIAILHVANVSSWARSVVNAFSTLSNVFAVATTKIVMTKVTRWYQMKRKMKN